MSPDFFALDDLHDTLLIGPGSTFQRVGWSAAASDQDVKQRLTRGLERTHTLGALRDCCRGWGVQVSRPPDMALRLVDDVVEAVARKRLAAYVLPPVHNVSTLGANVERAKTAVSLIRPTKLAMGTFPRGGSVAPPSPATLSLEQRLADILYRAEGYLPAARYGHVFEPVNIIKSVAVMALWARTPLAVTSHIMAAVFWAAPATAARRRLADRTADISALLDLIRAAGDEAAFEQAARRFSHLVEHFGADDFIRTMRIVPEKSRGGGPARDVHVYPPLDPIVRPPQERPPKDGNPFSLEDAPA